MNWLRRFLQHPPIRQLHLLPVQADAEQIERTRQKQEQARAAMGTKWIGHPRHGKVSESRLLRDWDEAITEDRLRALPRAVVNFHRRTK